MLDTPLPRRRKTPIHLLGEENLTARHRAVIKLAIEGMTTKEIANALGIGPSTVETFKYQIMQRLEAKSFLQACVIVALAEEREKVGIAA